MVSKIALNDPAFESLTLTRSETYPHEMRLHVRATYRRAVLILDRSDLPKSEEIEYQGRGFNVLRSIGQLELSRSNTNVMVDASLPTVWYPDPKSIDLVSAPLELSDIHEIDDRLGAGDIQVRWSLEAWALVEVFPQTEGSMSKDFLRVDFSCPRRFEITRQAFVRSVLEPADLLRRMFIEVVIEPIGSLDRIADPNVRETVKTLLDKQRILRDAYTKFVNAEDSKDYRSVISDVRLAIENLNTKDIRDVIKKAYEAIGIADGALEKVSDEISSVIVGQGEKGSMAPVYKFACKLASHAKTEDDQNYTPRPLRHDAEFALLQALNILDYLIHVLKTYNDRM
jgi:hypothetical protein